MTYADDNFKLSTDSFYVVSHPQTLHMMVWLSGTGDDREIGYLGVAHPCAPTRKDRRDHQPPQEF